MPEARYRVAAGPRRRHPDADQIAAVVPPVVPEPGRVDGSTSLVAVPPDIERLRATEPELAWRWRSAVRNTLTELVQQGGRIDGFDRAGWYVVRSDR